MPHLLSEDHTMQSRWAGIGWSLAGCVAALMLTTQAAGQAQITESRVKALLDTLDRAARSLDTTALIAHFSDDIVITLEAPGPEGPQRFRWNKQEYAKQLDEGYEDIEDYRFERTDTSIRIAPDGRTARVETRMTETIRMRGQRIFAVTRDKAQMELRDGRLVITRLDGVILEFEREDALDAV